MRTRERRGATLGRAWRRSVGLECGARLSAQAFGTDSYPCPAKPVVLWPLLQCCCDCRGRREPTSHSHNADPHRPLNMLMPYSTFSFCLFLLVFPSECLNELACRRRNRCMLHMGLSRRNTTDAKSGVVSTGTGGYYTAAALARRCSRALFRSASVSYRTG
jgi:hypothetical protein